MPFISSTLVTLIVLTVIHAASNSSLDDSSPFVSYSPEDSWTPSTVPCTLSSCLAIYPQSNQSAYQQTWHTGIHIIPNTDEDDEPGKTNSTIDTDGDAQSSTSVAAAVSTAVTENKEDDNDNAEVKSGSKRKGDKGTRRGLGHLKGLYVLYSLFMVYHSNSL